MAILKPLKGHMIHKDPPEGRIYCVVKSEELQFLNAVSGHKVACHSMFCESIILSW